MQKTFYQAQLCKAHEFSVDADVPLDQVFNMPYWMIDDYYDKGPWNYQKALNAKNDQIKIDILQALKNVTILLKR